MIHYKPGTDFAFLKVMMNGCKRPFQRGWLEKYPWLVYSKECDGGVSLACIFFSKHEKVGALVNNTFTWWTKVGSVCGEHEKLRFLSTSRKPEKKKHSSAN